MFSKNKTVFKKFIQAISKKKRSSKNVSGDMRNSNNSKTSADLGPRTGIFSRTCGFEAKDLTFETKAKDFKCVLEAMDVLEDSTSGAQSLHMHRVTICLHQKIITSLCDNEVDQFLKTLYRKNLLGDWCRLISWSASN